MRSLAEVLNDENGYVRPHIGDSKRLKRLTVVAPDEGGGEVLPIGGCF